MIYSLHILSLFFFREYYYFCFIDGDAEEEEVK